MATPDDVYDCAKKLLGQADAILNEPDPEARKRLPLDAPPESNWELLQSSDYTGRVRDRAISLYTVARHVQEGELPSVYSLEDLRTEIEKLRRLL